MTHPDLKARLNRAQDSANDVFDHFGVPGNLRRFSFYEESDVYWALLDRGSKCIWDPKPFRKVGEGEPTAEDEPMYSAGVRKDGDAPMVFRAADCTMVCLISDTFGEDSFAIFGNSKECVDPEMLEDLKLW